MREREASAATVERKRETRPEGLGALGGARVPIETSECHERACGRERASDERERERERPMAVEFERERWSGVLSSSPMRVCTHVLLARARQKRVLRGDSIVIALSSSRLPGRELR